MSYKFFKKLLALLIIFINIITFSGCQGSKEKIDVALDTTNYTEYIDVSYSTSKVTNAFGDENYWASNPYGGEMCTITVTFKFKDNVDFSNNIYISINLKLEVQYYYYDRNSEQSFEVRTRVEERNLDNILINNSLVKYKYEYEKLMLKNVYISTSKVTYIDGFVKI